MSNLGINLNDEEILNHIKKVYNKNWRKQLEAKGIDSDDALQEIYIGFMMRNIGTNPFNSDVSKESTYIHLVIKSVCINLLDKEMRYRRRAGYVGLEQDVSDWNINE